jgi:hypothetical protein
MRISKDDTQTRVLKLGYFGGLATRRAADVRAQALLSTVHEIQAAGFVRGAAKDGTAQAWHDC